MIYELKKQVGGETFVIVGDMTVDELIEAERDGYSIVQDKPKHKPKPKKRKKPFKLRHQDVDWSMFERAN